MNKRLFSLLPPKGLAESRVGLVAPQGATLDEPEELPRWKWKYLYPEEVKG